MRQLIAAAALLSALFLFVSVVWRYAVRHRSLPCPEWLVPLLENPYMNRVAGAAMILERAEIGPGMAVLDVGCGPGRLTIPVAVRVGPLGRVVGLDVQRSMLDRLGSKLDGAGLANVELIHAGAGDGALAGARFDRALLVTVLGEIPRREEALSEIHEALVESGVLSITEVLPDPHYQRRSTVRALALRTGFRVEKVFPGTLSYTMNLRKR